MWGRYIYELDWGEVVGLYQLTQPKEPPTGLGPTYNAMPTQMLSIVRPKDDGRELSLARWALFADDTTDADVETIRENPTIRDSFIKRRCIVPATGWYEWRDGGAEPKPPYYFFRPISKPLAFAGIWDRWQDNRGAVVLSFAIVTAVVPSPQFNHYRCQ